ncbi:polynucleotide adenylyltransferase PcnB [Catenovulum sp. 2E275]|nr:polynucleotide adenylyltransferase PcnB [Catenovulum sp. 2E275]MCU4675500.1 polynucleotide adenylyltransferase PcnB [Catenovulum sp. 2E275]
MPRSEHNISRKHISKNALKVLYRLKDCGFDAYLVGGGVRDILLGLQPKDFDIATNATPEQIKSLFSNCRLIGRRFRLAHIVFGRDIIEVATLRGHHDEEQENLGKQSEHGQLLRDNVYGTIDEDAERRDFSANALYYNIADYSILDYWGGVEAIANKQIDLIGDPETRYREDPVRMLRAIRFAVKLDMQITDSTAKPIKTLAPLLQNIPKARLFEECLKLFLAGQGLNTFKFLVEYQLFQQIFPNLAEQVADTNSKTYALITHALHNTDDRVNRNLRITPAFLFAAFLWYEVESAKAHYLSQQVPEHDALFMAIHAVLDSGQYNVVIPKRFSSTIREIWLLQPRLEKRAGKRSLKVLENPKFRAAYDFLLLRAQVEQGDLAELANWWTELQQSDELIQKDLIAQVSDDKPRRSRRRNPKRRKKPQQ